MEEKVAEVELDSQQLNSRYQSSEPLQLSSALSKKYSHVTRLVEDGVQAWSDNLTLHQQFDLEVTSCQNELTSAEEFEEAVSSHATELQSQLLLEVGK